MFSTFGLCIFDNQPFFLLLFIIASLTQIYLYGWGGLRCKMHSASVLKYNQKRKQWTKKKSKKKIPLCIMVVVGSMIIYYFSIAKLLKPFGHSCQVQDFCKHLQWSLLFITPVVCFKRAWGDVSADPPHFCQVIISRRCVFHERLVQIAATGALTWSPVRWLATRFCSSNDGADRTYLSQLLAVVSSPVSSSNLMLPMSSTTWWTSTG